MSAQHVAATYAAGGSRSWGDDVVLLDERGRPVGRARKSDVHGDDTPLHLAVSTYVVRQDRLLLVTRRSAVKRTFPGVWTNACCGHPRPDESLDAAVRRHLRDELGLVARRVRLALPDFVYRASMADGCVEHELCPVFVAEVDDEPRPDPDEVADHAWVSWPDLRRRIHEDPDWSPWSRAQIDRLGPMMDDPLEWVRTAPQGVPRAGRRSDPHVAFDPLFDRQVTSLLDEFLTSATSALAELDDRAAEVVVPIRNLIEAGGKRLRPRLVHCGHAAGSPADPDGRVDPDVVVLAASVEMLHTFALLHDDVMDRSATRRGRRTAHLELAEMHRSRSRRGDSAWFGVSAALVCGDLAFSWADELLDLMSCGAARTRALRSVYATLRREVIAGQYLDLRFAGQVATDTQALTVALLKSGRYSVTRPLELGAVLSGASPATLETLRSYGDAIGVAFQLRDDVLGVFGDQAVTGKGAADDIRDGKASLLLVRAIELAADGDRRTLDTMLGRGDLADDEVEECRRIVRASGALASIEALIAAKVERATGVLGRLPAPVAATLEFLAETAALRDG